MRGTCLIAMLRHGKEVAVRIQALLLFDSLALRTTMIFTREEVAVNS
jgi:hypothetical protein